MFGKLVDYKIQDNIAQLYFEKGTGNIKVISPDIINVYTFKSVSGSDAIFSDTKWERNTVNAAWHHECVRIATGKLIINISEDFRIDIYDTEGCPLCLDYGKEREPFKRRAADKIAGAEGIDVYDDHHKHKVEVIKTMLGGEYFYGLGESTGHFNKRGYSYEMWNTDNPAPHVEKDKSMYKSIPFYIALREGKAYGLFFSNTYRTYFDMGKENSSYYYFGADEGDLDYYFIYGPSVKEVIEGYTLLTGRTPLPPIWGLGYQQSRWSYFPEKRVMELTESFRTKDIPCDVLYLDIDYMDGYRVFTWDNKRFPDPSGLLKRLRDMGFRVVTIIDPGVKKNKGYKIYDEGIKNGYFAADADGIPYVNKVWPGDALFPDFTDSSTSKWWSQNQSIMLKYGVSGIWNDMNEPASFNGPLPDDVCFKNGGREAKHGEIHNIYGLLMSKATFEGIKDYTHKRPFVLTRACYSGIQKYSAVWTGDNHSIWEHLRLSIPMLLNLGLSGISFAGVDVGGFSFDCTSELLARWTQAGCLFPFFRNHSSMSTRDQEPWAFDEDTERICRKYIKLRYRLLPYIYDEFWKSEKTGLPFMRPLLLDYQEDQKVLEINDQFMAGESILAAPVLEQGKTERLVYLPQGNWIDYWTGEMHEGGKCIIKEAPLDMLPLFIKDGSVIPVYGDISCSDERNKDSITFEIFPGNCSYDHILDDGESYGYRSGEYNHYRLAIKEEEECLTITMDAINKYEDGYKEFSFIVRRVNAQNITKDNERIPFSMSGDSVLFAVSNDFRKIQIYK